MPVEGAAPARLTERFADGRAAPVERALVIEAPIAIEINGIGYAVMMGTPADLTDYALGFCLSEQLIASPADFLSAEAHAVPAGGWMLRVQLAAEAGAPLLDRARLRLAEGSCGLCGIESLEQVLRPLRSVPARLDVPDAAVFRAVAALPDYQPLGRATRAAHAAAFCTPDGAIVLVREDVGRHNALDKLLGALAREGQSPATGFIVLTARCSFELVQKAVIAGCPLLVTISAASTLAVEQAAAHGLRLLSLARADSLLES
ncbi:formate dehydrogenase accessory sulfurtransferase FdhD [Novosphingobium sp. KCTC 2891]|uniref:formate dehydrogenase accessory sulfurtransferase FdhD n=1 Tax=Novosphingobium sp. KCTC 2891 TaxID=2989730 RepID=UPI0022214D16|nr:formate dehydrogenase accessory sulfurtransferase FdhD [Novosphingobium sp. KCTC 2891]MCW1383538.1 formate dehydrogenase accessory sulfurtransferase FdhD [Novosphingobium sp. KCTC 2891]